MKRQLTYGILALMVGLQFTGCGKNNVPKNKVETVAGTVAKQDTSKTKPSEDEENVDNETDSDSLIPMAKQVKLIKESDMYEPRVIEKVNYSYTEDEKAKMLDNMMIDNFGGTFEVVDKIWYGDKLSQLSLLVKNNSERPQYMTAIIRGYEDGQYVGVHNVDTLNGIYIEPGQTLPVIVGNIDVNAYGKSNSLKVDLLITSEYSHTYKGCSKDAYKMEKGELTRKETKSGKTKTSCKVDFTFDVPKINPKEYKTNYWVVFKKNGKAVDVDRYRDDTGQEKVKAKFSTYADADDYDVYISFYTNKVDHHEANPYVTEDFDRLKDKLGTMERGLEYYSEDGNCKMSLQDVKDGRCLVTIDNISDVVISTTTVLDYYLDGFAAGTTDDIGASRVCISKKGLKPGEKAHYVLNTTKHNKDIVMLNMYTHVYDYDSDAKEYRSIAAIPDENKECEYVERLSGTNYKVYELKNWDDKYDYQIDLFEMDGDTPVSQNTMLNQKEEGEGEDKKFVRDYMLYKNTNVKFEITGTLK